MRNIIKFLIGIYVLVSMVHMGYMLACYRSASAFDWCYFSVYGTSMVIYKLIKDRW